MVPVGHPKVLSGPQITLPLSSYFGFAKVTVLPPRQLYHPVLPARINGKLSFVLCRTCAEMSNQERCTHIDSQRKLTGTWVTDELQVAKDAGYEVCRVHEVWHWEKRSDKLFRDYVNHFQRMKQEADGWPTWCFTDEQKKKYVDDYFRHEGVHLRPERIAKNPALRELAKLCLNR